MDEEARNSWASKRSWHQRERKKLLNKSKREDLVFRETAANIGAMANDWIDICVSWWEEREQPDNPAQVADVLKREIGEIITCERDSIVCDLVELWAGRRNNHFQEGEAESRESCKIHKDKCDRRIASLRDKRIRTMDKDKKESRRRWKEIIIVAGLAWAGGVSTTLITQQMSSADSAEQSKIYEARFSDLTSEVSGLRQAKHAQTRIYEARMSKLADEVHTVGRANVALQEDIAVIRRDYRRMVAWTLKTPEQIDREIMRLRKDLERKKGDIAREFVRKRGEHHSDMIRRQITRSSIATSGEEVLNKQEKQALADAEQKARRATEDLLEQKKRLTIPQ
ncbi:hypothetical protein ACFL2T_06375 [Elusimicrobiota bacterium]